MNLEKVLENQSAGVGLPPVDKLPKDGAFADKKKAAGGRTVLYARVSTAEQTLAHQSAQAEAAGFHLDEVVADHGVSGVSTGLADRPEGRRLSICSAPGTSWSFVGWIGLAETIAT